MVFENLHSGTQVDNHLVMFHQFKTTSVIKVSLPGGTHPHLTITVLFWGPTKLQSILMSETDVSVF